MACLPVPPQLPGQFWDDKLQHALAFSVLTVLAPPTRGWTMPLGMILFGGLIELLQMIPILQRDSSFLDLLADCAGVVLGLVVSRFLYTGQFLGLQLRKPSSPNPFLKDRSVAYPTALSYGLHPHWPERLGYRRVLQLVNPKLREVLRVTDPYTLVSGRNRTTIYREALGVLERKVPGQFLEIGVHRGGSAGVLAHLLLDQNDRELHLYDRWGDLPEPTEKDGEFYDTYRKAHIGDKLARLRDDPPLADTRHLIQDIIKFPAERTFYHQGWYDETLPTYSGGPIAFATVDCDYYESVKLTMKFLEDHAAAGAVLIIDDYGAWPGAKTAVDEWLEVTPRQVTKQVLEGLGPAVLRVIA